MTIAPPNTERFTVDEYMRRAALEGWKRVELEVGVVIEMSTEHLHHARTIANVSQRLVAALPDADCFPCGTLPLSVFTAYEPDILVLDAVPPPDAMLPAAGHVSLVVEVAFSSRTRDLRAKARYYAAAEIPEYRVVEPERGVLHRHTCPGPEGYAEVVPFDVGCFAESLDVLDVLAVLDGRGA